MWLCVSRARKPFFLGGSDAVLVEFERHAFFLICLVATVDSMPSSVYFGHNGEPRTVLAPYQKALSIGVSSLTHSPFPSQANALPISGLTKWT